MIRPQGTTAVYMGKREEETAEHFLQSLGYTQIDGKQAKLARRWVASGRDIGDWCRTLSVPSVLLVRQPTILNLYGDSWKVDLTIWHKDLWPRCLFVEIKTQSISGSVDAKIPYAVFSLKKQKRPTGLLLIGSGFCQGCIHWAEDEQDENFVVWRNVSTMRNYVETGKSVFSNSVRPRVVTKSQHDLDF